MNTKTTIKKSFLNLKRAIRNRDEKQRESGTIYRSFSWKAGQKLSFNKPTVTRDEVIAQLPRIFETHGLKPTDLDTIKKTLITREKQRKKEKLERQQLAEEAQRQRLLPENEIPRCYFTRIAYPIKFQDLTKNYSLKDFVHVRDLFRRNRLTPLHGESPQIKTQFETWLNTTIDILRG